MIKLYEKRKGLDSKLLVLIQVNAQKNPQKNRNCQGDF